MKYKVYLALFLLFISSCYYNGHSLLDALQRKNNKEAAKLVKRDINVNYSDYDGNTPLIYVASGLPFEIYNRDESYSFIKLLLRAGAEIEQSNNEGVSPLMTAIIHENTWGALALIEEGANVNKSFGEYSITPLIKAINLKMTKVTRTLINAGADIHFRDELDLTPILWASVGDSYKIVKLLVESGANIEDTTLLGETPLMLAIEEGNIEIVRYLLDKGANIKHNCSSGETPLSLAEEHDNYEITKLVKERIR